MKTEDVPQDCSPTYGGYTKLIYAVGINGEYEGVPSNGWEVESYATQSAVRAFENMAQEALVRCRAGASSPLEYHMFAKRMDLDTLSAATGYAHWRIRRHLRAHIFTKLSDRKLAPYTRALGMGVPDLRALPN